MRPATGWMAYFTDTPLAVSLAASSLTECCARATARPYPGTMITDSALPSTKAASSALPLLTLRCSVAPAAALTSPPKPPEDHAHEAAVHGLAHDEGEDGAGAAHQAAGNDQHAVVEAEADAGRGPARIAVEHGHHDGHVGAADGDDQRHAQHESQDYGRPQACDPGHRPCKGRWPQSAMHPAAR